MPRQVRIEYEGATYHVICRGDRREPIYEDNTDREIHLATLAQASTKTGWRVHAYALMGNHYHFLIETPKANLVAGMTWLQSTYTKRYNARHQTSGHLFGDRYKAVLVEADGGDYFRTVLDYIHLNPVRAGLVPTTGDGSPDLFAFPWTSLGSYSIRPSQRPHFLETARGLAAWDAKDTPRGRREFLERLVEQASRERAEACGLVEIEGQGLQSTLRRGWCFGSTGFKERLLEATDTLLGQKSAAPGGDFCGAEVKDHGEHRAKQILDAGLEELGLGANNLPSLRKAAEEKGLIALVIRRETTVPLAWIASELSMGSTSNVSATCARMETVTAEKRRLRRLLAKIYSRISD